MEKIIKLINQAKEKFYQNDFLAAKKSYTKVINLVNKHAYLFEERGVCNYYLGNNEEAIMDFQNAVAYSRDNHLANYYIGQIYIEKQEYQKASKYIKAAIDNYGECQEYFAVYAFIQHKLENRAEEEKFIEKLLSADNRGLYDLFMVAYNIIDEDKLELAIYIYKILLDTQYNKKPILNNIGFGYSKLGRYEEGVSYFNACLELAPDYSIAYNNRGFCKFHLGQVEEGLKDINKSLERNPKNAYAYKDLGIIYRSLGDEAQAIKHFNTALKLNFTEQYGPEVVELLKN